MKSVCFRCGDPVDPQKTGVYREVTGWEKVRQGGAAGAIMLRKETGLLLCAGCGEREKLHARLRISEGQGSLM